MAYDLHGVGTPRVNYGKYGAMTTWLAATTQRDEVDLTFNDVEAVLGFPLPPSSRRQSSFWQSHKGSSFGQAVHDAGWRVKSLDLSIERVEFERDIFRPSIVNIEDAPGGVMHRLNSSLIRGIRYGSEQQVLTVYLRDGAYRYEGIPKALFLRFLNAASPGRFFLAEVKDRFPFKLLSDASENDLED